MPGCSIIQQSLIQHYVLWPTYICLVLPSGESCSRKELPFTVIGLFNENSPSLNNQVTSTRYKIKCCFQQCQQPQSATHLIIRRIYIGSDKYEAILHLSSTTHIRCLLCLMLLRDISGVAIITVLSHCSPTFTCPPTSIHRQFCKFKVGS